MLTNAPQRTTTGPTVVAYAIGLLVTVAGLGYTLYDQLVTHGLDDHLHALYDPVGRYGEPGPLYVFVHASAVVGVLTWVGCLRLVRRGSPRARRWSTWALGLSAIVVFTPVAIQEYGQPVLPWALMIAPILAWVAGLAGTAALWLRRAAR